MRMRAPWRAVGVACLVAASSACSSIRYYAHVSAGQLQLLTHRRSVAALIADPQTDPRLRERLRGSQQARVFASDRLDLPRNRSYTTYVELGRPSVTWNVFATAEFSIEPVTHCFPFAGCVAYVGYFDKSSAEREAARLAALGDDTSVDGAAAYSTLGWFADPILSSMLRWSDDELDGVIFHELAHQRLYVKDDTAFNESYASFVEQEGLREWRTSRGLAPGIGDDTTRDAEFTQLVLGLRDRLGALYAHEREPDIMRAEKQREFAEFRERYRRLRDDHWAGEKRYDTWVATPLNNARLLPFGLYDRWVPAFAQVPAAIQAHVAQVFDNGGKRWPEFHAAVGRIAGLPTTARENALRELLAARANARPESP